MLRPANLGFTVVELLITLIVIGVLFTAFTTTFAGLENISKKGNDVTAASTQAFSKLQAYENLNYNSLPTTNPAGSLVEVEDFSASLPTSLESPRVGKVYINSQTASIKQVLVRVTFGAGPSQRFIEYVTFIQRNGVGR
jgi:prepilin-type N-terminal cleavage/methylation domain-containing protein